MFLKLDARKNEPELLIEHDGDCVKSETWVTFRKPAFVSWQPFEKRRLPIAHAVLRLVRPDPLRSAVKSSRWILGIKDNFDGRQSPHYSEETLDRAIAFVRVQWEEYLREKDELMPIPEILPGPHGSIDILWKRPEFELLVNIPSDPEKDAEFSGEDRNGGKFDGNIGTARPNRGLVSWLAA